MTKAANAGDSIFERKALHHTEVDWGEYLNELTPVEPAGELLFKREDRFAPLGYGGINGAKLRQLIHLVGRYRAAGGRAGLLTGASVLSPQLPMAAAVAQHYGLPSTLVLGSTNAESAIKRDMVRMAAWFGARFDYGSRVAYNPVLQDRCKRLVGEAYREHFYLEYGITCDHRLHAPADVLAFHAVGARQVDNLPDTVTDLVVPAGSCNSCTSILHGLVQNPKPNLRNIYLVGIGPSKLDLINARLRIFEELTGVAYRGAFECGFDTDADMLAVNRDLFPARTALYNLHYYDLHGTGQVQYDQPQPYSYGGIDFHPTYEGKVMNWLMRTHPELVRPTTLVWIVGSQPSLHVMEPYLRAAKGACPTVALAAEAGR